MWRDGDDSAITTTMGAMTAATVNIPRSTSRRQESMLSSRSSRSMRARSAGRGWLVSFRS